MSLLRFLGPALVLLTVAATNGCAAPTSGDEGGSTQGAATAGAAPIEPVATKLAETPAANEGATGVRSWVTYLTATPGAAGKADNVGFLSYGVDLDGVLLSVLYLDLRTGAFAAFENKSTLDGCTGASASAGCTAAADKALPLYGAELKHILAGIAPAGASATGQSHALARRGDACLSTVALSLGAVVVGTAAALTATVLVPLEATAGALAATVAAAGAAGAAVGTAASAYGGSVLFNVLGNQGKTWKVALIGGFGDAGAMYSDAYVHCLRGN